MLKNIRFNKNKDKIAIIAPAFGCNDESRNLDKAKSFERLNCIIAFFKQHNFDCIYDDQVFAADGLGYFSSSKAERLRQFKNALENPEIGIIFAFRGGYGCTEIVIDCLDIKPSNNKILIGFSDITALHLLFNQHYKMHSIHGSMSPYNKPMLEEVISVLDGNNITLDLESINFPAKSNDKISGEMFGGNLTIICNMIGTRLNPVTKDKILFLEDVSESGYRVHRNLIHMKNAGLFDNVAAVIFADFIESDDHINSSISSFISEYLVNIPVYNLTGVGHGEINHPIIIGAIGKIDGNSLTISILKIGVN